MTKVSEAFSNSFHEEALTRNFNETAVRAKIRLFI